MTQRRSAALLALALTLGGCDGCGADTGDRPLCAREVRVHIDIAGAGPEEVERAMIPLEGALVGIASVRAVRGLADEGHGRLEVELVDDADRSTVLLAMADALTEVPLTEGVEVALQPDLSTSARLAFVPLDDPRGTLGRDLTLTIVPAMLRAAELEPQTLARRVREALGSDPPSEERLRAIRVGGLPLENLATLGRASLPQVAGPNGPLALALGTEDGTPLNVHQCDGAPPVTGFVRARLQTRSGSSAEERIAQAAPLVELASAMGHEAFVLLDLDIEAALRGERAPWAGITEVVVLSEAPDLARAWRDREEPGVAITVDASDVRRFVVSVEEARSGASLARLATSPVVAEMLPGLAATAQLEVEPLREVAARFGISVQTIEEAVRFQRGGIEVVPGLWLRPPPGELRDISLRSADGSEVRLESVASITRGYRLPIARLDGHRTRRLEARILPDADPEALRDQVLGR